MRRILKCAMISAMISAMIAAVGSSFVGCGFSFDAAEESPRSIAATPGDVNSDGVVTMADVELNETAADMDGNGYVSNDSLQLLLQNAFPARA